MSICKSVTILDIKEQVTFISIKKFVKLKSNGADNAGRNVNR